MDTIIRQAQESDWLYIDSLRKREGSALGFCPKDTYLTILQRSQSKGSYYFTSRIFVLEDNGDLTGFVYASFSGIYTKIHQIVVQEDARRWYRATLLESKIDELSRKYLKYGIECRVAVDLEANFYWRAMGYEPIKQITSTWLNQRESKSKRPLWYYKKNFDNLPLVFL